ncbi:protein kinase-like protein [Streptomyces sp. CG 926]|nr:protein kinase-like protein [Streptomyces sp. CG 926]
MGSVHLSRTRGNQPVALKVIRRELAQEQDFRVRFEREVQAARSVQGYHIVPVLDHDTSGEQPWPATAFVPGLALDDTLATYGPLPLPAMFQLIGCTAQALHSIHAASVVHRDLKPSNMLLGSNGPQAPAPPSYAPTQAPAQTPGRSPRRTRPPRAPARWAPSRARAPWPW